MSSDASGAAPVRPADVEAWFAELGLAPVERADREAITSWDLVLDGHRRFDLRVTVILDPDLGLICWAHYAPPINDLFRKSYRKLLRWNDEFPFAKFSVGEDERPLLAVELPLRASGVEELGLGLARIVGIADALFDESKDWLWLGGRAPDQSDRRCRNEALLERFTGQLAELFEPAADLSAVAVDPADPAGRANPTDPAHAAERANPTDPADPAERADPADPATPTNPADPATPANPADPAETATTVQTPA